MRTILLIIAMVLTAHRDDPEREAAADALGVRPRALKWNGNAWTT